MEIPKHLNDLCYRIVGICMEIHRELGPGFPEEYYQRAMEHELSISRMKFEAEKPVQVYYKSVPVGLSCLDFLVEDELVLEFKSVSRLEDVHLAQVIKYLSAANLKFGLLVNFGEQSLNYKTVVLPVKLQKATSAQKVESA